MFGRPSPPPPPPPGSVTEVAFQAVINACADIGLTTEPGWNPFTIAVTILACLVLGMVLSVVSPPLYKTIRRSTLVVDLLVAVWLVILTQYLVPMLLLMPLALVPRIGTTAYRKLTGWYDAVARLAAMAPPYSWCGCSVYMHGYDAFVDMKSRGNAVMLSTHCSRIDWLIGIFMGVSRPSDPNVSRIGFVAEATTALMPVIGWSRVLFGDIFVTRAFHKVHPYDINCHFDCHTIDRSLRNDCHQKATDERHMPMIEPPLEYGSPPGRPAHRAQHRDLPPLWHRAHHLPRA